MERSTDFFRFKWGLGLYALYVIIKWWNDHMGGRGGGGSGGVGCGGCSGCGGCGG
jgi:hypothetical protein